MRPVTATTSVENVLSVRRAAVLSAILVSCARSTTAPSPAPTPPAAPDDRGTPTDSFGPLADRIIAEHLELHPDAGVELGLHSFDGRLPDVSRLALERQDAWLAASIEALTAVETNGLSSLERVEHAALLYALRGYAFGLGELRAPFRNPMFYMGPLALTPYISRNYAPVATRAEKIASIAEATPGYLKHAKENLDFALPRTFVTTALMQTRGNIAFVRNDVPPAMKELGQPAIERRLQASLAAMIAALEDYAMFLEKRLESANDDFAVGESRFVRMLEDTQGIAVDLPFLGRVLQRDLDRNLATLVETARKIDPTASTATVVARVAAERPEPSQVLDVATEQARRMRAFVAAHDLASIPSDAVARVVETPPFMRWNAAFLDPAGVFERTALPSFYYITPPDPDWPRAKQRAYVPGHADLLFITIHEVWPGHFLHGLHIKKNPSRRLKYFWNYTMGEGWAHYAEELMWEQGVSSDPKVHIGQLLNALLRNVRAISAIGLHAQGMSVENSQRLFEEKAFQDAANAEQQAIRGTFDPMYLAYTVGKLAIKKLRADARTKAGRAGQPFTLREFHDRVLSYGAAPITAIREAMLGRDSGSLL